ncbi:MAG: GTP-binding protein [Woeseiaceae bacterium]|nr:GTP-binding protein [Woeseiaceae bacterium]
MATVTSKVCVVGDFAVGKTSVVERFINNQFSDKYLTTVGVKVDTKLIDHQNPPITHKLVLWDVAGSDRFGHAEFAYLRGASGYIFVVDGTRSMTLRSVHNLREQITEKYGAAPCVLLVNKKDLTSQWEVGEKQMLDLVEQYCNVYTTSAKTGEDVEDALQRLAELVIANDLKSE